MELVVIVAICGAAYLLPWLIAWRRGHPQVVAIFLLNLLLGWTVLGWVCALVWSATAVRPTPTTSRPAAPTPQPRHEPTPKPRLGHDPDRPKPPPWWKER